MARNPGGAIVASAGSGASVDRDELNINNGGCVQLGSAAWTWSRMKLHMWWQCPLLLSPGCHVCYLSYECHECRAELATVTCLAGRNGDCLYAVPAPSMLAPDIARQISWCRDTCTPAFRRPLPLSMPAPDDASVPLRLLGHRVAVYVVETVLLPSALAGGSSPTPAPEPAPAPASGSAYIYDVISSNANLTTFKTAIDAAGLKNTIETDTLTWTVFAPTDDVRVAGTAQASSPSRH